MKVWQGFLAGLINLCVTSALTMGPVRLFNNSRYINFKDGVGNNSFLECVYHLEGDEQVEQVSWELWHREEISGTYDWYSNGENKATGVLWDAVDLSRDDGELQLHRLQYDFSGNYSCRVTLTSGEHQDTARWEVLIIDTISEGTMKVLPGNTDCTFAITFKSPTIFPDFIIRAGMYSEKLLDYYEEAGIETASKWSFGDGSVYYTLRTKIIRIDSYTPSDASFMIKLGVNKANGDHIYLKTYTYVNDKIWNERGCPDLRRDARQLVKYDPKHRETCRGERKRGIMATVTCAEGYHAVGNVTTLQLKCDVDTLTWVALDSQPVAAIKDLVCVSEGAPNVASLSAILLGTALIFLSLTL